jgi:hypothetical protein
VPASARTVRGDACSGSRDKALRRSRRGRHWFEQAQLSLREVSDLLDGGSVTVALTVVEPENLARVVVVPPGGNYIERILPGPWLNVLGAARWLGNPCINGRAPNSVYAILEEVGGKFNGRWIVHCDDLDAYIRQQIGRPPL